MTRDDLEFSIAQYADGTLPASERAALEDMLARDADARALLAEYRDVDAALRSAGEAAPVPDVRWDALAEHIGRAVERQAGTVLAEDVEFALAQFADGTLAQADRPAVEARLADDPAARTVVGDYEAVDTFARRAAAEAPPPDVRWEALAGHLADAVARHAALEGDLPESIERAVAEYANGTLADVERDAVDATLASDSRARLALADYARLDSLLRQAPLPDVRWDALAEHLSTVVAADADEQDRREAERAGRFRLFGRIKSFRAPAWIAAAASVLVATGLGIRLLRTPVDTTPVVQVSVGPRDATPAASGSAVVEVAAFRPDEAPAEGTAVATIAVGPGPAVPGGVDGVDDDFATRPSRTIVTASAVDEDEVAVRDGAAAPY